MTDQSILYTQLLDALPKEYSVIVDVQRVKKDTVQNMLVKLQDKESKLGKKKSSSYLSHDKPSRKAKASRHRHSSSSSLSSSPSPTRSHKSSKPRTIFICPLCEGNHIVRECPDLDRAVRYLSSSRSRLTSKS